MTRRVALLLLLFLLVCAPTRAEPPRLLASIAPLHSLAASVMEGVAKPELLLPASRSPHDFALKPSDMRRLGQADLVLWLGRGVEAPLFKALRAVERQGLVEIELLARPEFGTDAAQTGEGEGQGHGHGHELGIDPHIWLSPDLAGQIVAILVEQLVRLDPANGEHYRLNGERTLVRLRELDQGLRTLLAPVAGVPFAVFHDAYGYFVRQYGLRQVGAITLNPQQPSSAGQLLALQERLRQAGARCLFSEPQFPPKLVRRMAEAGGLATGELDPLGVGIEPGPEAYFVLLRGLGASFQQCLSQGPDVR
jgi:zinc transport system substrate-binding protein